VPDHRPGVDDFVEPLLADVAGLERGLLQGQAFVIRLVRDGGSLVIAGGRSWGGKSVKSTSFEVKLMLPIKLPRTGILIS